MQIVIDIPNDLLERVKNECQREWETIATPNLLRLFQVVANGTPLEKIRDEIAELSKDYNEYGWAYNDALEVIDKYIEARSRHGG